MILWLALGTLLAAAPPADAQAPVRILFVGNSYTYTHDVPGLVQAIAAARGVEVEVDDLTAGGAAIEDHVLSGQLERRLAQAHWDWMVLQQGPSSQLESREHLIEWTARASALAAPRGVRVAMFSVWPALPNVHTWTNAETSYAEAARLNQACVLPAAAVWRRARLQHPEIDLYSSDQLHADRAGALLAALTIAEGFFPSTPQTTPPALEAVLTGSAWRNAIAQVPTMSSLVDAVYSNHKQTCARRH